MHKHPFQFLGFRGVGNCVLIRNLVGVVQIGQGLVHGHHPVLLIGLDDTVQQYNETTGEGTGFKFGEASPNGIYYTVGWAVSTYYDRPAHYKMMQQQAMVQCYTWEESARQYEQIYQRAIDIKLDLS